jgi:hypothetical protein
MIEKVPEYKDLLQFLPDSVEDLRIVGPLEMGDDLAPWLKSAMDDSWLPNSKTISFQLTLRRRNEMPSQEKILEVSSQVQKFLDLLVANRSLLQIVD